MKIAFKNFLQTLRRYKVASLLNVAGLTLALAAVTAVTALTVTICIWRAANENPAESIKSE